MTLRHPLRAAALAVLLLSGGLSAAAAETVRSERHAFRVETLAGGLEHPWSVAFLPEGGMLITERAGRLRLYRGGRLDPRPFAGAPEVFADGQGGLLEVLLHPGFAENRLIYLSYSAHDGRAAHTRVTRYRLDLDGHRLTDGKRIFDGTPRVNTSHHFGGRMVFDRDGYLYLTVGERGQRDDAQDLSRPGGSVMRLRDDGAVPEDNPFVGRDGARAEIFTYGHRNPQGMARHPETGAIWIHEHGARGGDEVNILRAGRNYGWPVISYGTHYSGEKIGVGTRKEGMEQPLHYWVPSIAPSGMAFYTGDRFPGWRGDLFVGGLIGQVLVRLALDGTKVTREERLLEDRLGRIRDVRAGPDGYLYLTTDEAEGRLLRLVPAE
jgi:glucose/arabinose dehydrogenase